MKTNGEIVTVEKADVLLTVADVCAITRRTSRAVYLDIAAGRLPPGIKLGGRRLWKRDDLMAALDGLGTGGK